MNCLKDRSYSGVPYKTVFLIQLSTNNDRFKGIKYGYHYIGNDLSYFKYPDKELLISGNVLTDRQFEIIKLVRAGLRSKQPKVTHES